MCLRRIASGTTPNSANSSSGALPWISTGLAKPGYVRAPSGMVYALVFIGRSGEPFPDGIEIYGLPDALEPLNEADLDTDLWALLRWIIEGTGGEWRVEDLDATGRLYRLAAAGTG